MSSNSMLTMARILAVVWAAFWSWFGVMSSLDHGPHGTVLQGLIHLFPWFLWAVTGIFVAWRQPVLGGGILLVQGLVLSGLMVTYLRGTPFLFLTLALPPVVAGYLFIAAGRSRGTSHPE